MNKFEILKELDEVDVVRLKRLVQFGNVRINNCSLIVDGIHRGINKLMLLGLVRPYQHGRYTEAEPTPLGKEVLDLYLTIKEVLL